MWDIIHPGYYPRKFSPWYTRGHYAPFEHIPPMLGHYLPCFRLVLSLIICLRLWLLRVLKFARRLCRSIAAACEVIVNTMENDEQDQFFYGCVGSLFDYNVEMCKSATRSVSYWTHRASIVRCECLPTMPDSMSAKSNDYVQRDMIVYAILNTSLVTSIVKACFRKSRDMLCKWQISIER